MNIPDYSFVPQEPTTERKKRTTADFFNCIVNERFSLSTQLLTLFAILTILSGGITLGICIGMLYGVADTAYTNSESIILDNTVSNTKKVGIEIADAINQRLTTISDSICQVSAEYSLALLTHPISDGTNVAPMWQPTDSFREYKFTTGCTYPNCPSDYARLDTRSRVRTDYKILNGSVYHSSVYLYSGYQGIALRDDSSWSSAFSLKSYLQLALDGLAFLDSDFNVLYNQGPESTVMFYLSTQVSISSSTQDYYSLHRTFPGFTKNDTTYDPTQRAWFKNAQPGSTFVYGPYHETFTHQQVITLSTKRTTGIQGHPTNVVAAAVVLIDDLKSLINEIRYANNGFGVLINSKRQVLVWGNESDIYDPQSDRFRVLADYDASLDPHIKNLESGYVQPYVAEYSDAEGKSWYVSVVPFFDLRSQGYYAFTMLVFSAKADAEKPLISLRENIDKTTTSVSMKTIIIVCITVYAVMCLVGLFLWYITAPLNNMKEISTELIRLSTEDEEFRDYTGVLHSAYNNISRHDEVGILASDYYHIICMLQNKVLEKRAIPKFPMNPFYISDPNVFSYLSWEIFYQMMFSTASQVPHALQELHTEPEAGDLDILASISRNKASIVPLNYSRVGDVELGNMGTQSDPNNVVQQREDGKIGLIEIEPTRQVNPFASLSTQLYMLMLILLTGLILTMILTVMSLRSEGSTWMDKSGDQLVDVQVLNLQEIAQTKSRFVESFFQQLNIDLVSAGTVLTQVLDGKLNRPNYLTNGYYFQSYSIDANNPYSAPSSSYEYSGYFTPADAGCFGSSCLNTVNAAETKLTSLYDLKFKSYFFESGTLNSFYQFGLTDGFTRYFPYNPSTSNSNPTSCVTLDYPGVCHTKYANSLCSGVGYSYAPYDPRCRPWYNLGQTTPDQSKVAYRYPGVAASGKYVLAAVYPLHQNNVAASSFYGVLSSNFLVETLSDAINSLKILHSGYSYLIDTNNITSIVLHPTLGKNCRFVECAEGFSELEYQEFYNSILVPIRDNPSEPVTTTYKKKGETWRFVSHPVIYETVSYTLILTVPDGEVLEASTKTQESIDKTVVGMIVAFAFAIAFFVILFYFFTYALITAIVRPIDDLRKLFQRILQEDYTVDIPTTASSYDLKVLMKALSNLLIALRFGSDSFARGNTSKAEKLFLEALQLFTILKNQRGIGACYNNLAMLTLSQQRFTESKDYMMKSIEIAQQQLDQLKASIESNGSYLPSLQIPSSTQPNQEQSRDKKHLLIEKYKTERILSDRQGNLVLVHLEQGNFQEAFALLEKLLEEDKKNLYIRGCVVKQGILGQYYLKQKEIASAEKIFNSALQFIEQGHMANAAINAAQDNPDQRATWHPEETYLAEQLALYNLVLLLEIKGDALLSISDAPSNNPNGAPLGTVQSLGERNGFIDQIINRYLYALTKSPYMHTNTVKNILITLKLRYFHKYHHLQQYEQQVEVLAKKYDFQLATKGGTVNVNGGSMGSRNAKRVAFAIDYSGSMSGTKIRSAVANLKLIFQNYIYDQDSISIITFSHQLFKILPLTVKNGQTAIIERQIDSLTYPTGSTALYDAIDVCYKDLSQSASYNSAEGNDWVVALTDGEDNASSISIDRIRNAVSNSSFGLIIIGVGNDVQTNLLMSITKSCAKGHYVAASGDKQSIDDAFGQVANIINSQMILEDI